MAEVTDTRPIASVDETVFITRLFNKHANVPDGVVEGSSLLSLCRDLNIRPWKVLQGIDGKKVSKEQFIDFWFDPVRNVPEPLPVKPRKTPDKKPDARGLFQMLHQGLDEFHTLLDELENMCLGSEDTRTKDKFDSLKRGVLDLTGAL